MGDPAVCSRPHPPPLACFFLSVCLNFYTCTCTCIMASRYVVVVVGVRGHTHPVASYPDTRYVRLLAVPCDGTYGYGYGYILGPSPVPPIYLSGSFGLVRPAWIRCKPGRNAARAQRRQCSQAPRPAA